MSYLFLAPHHDDETLFGAFSILRYRPTVIVVYASLKQEADGITLEQRMDETENALSVLGVPAFTQWPVPDGPGDHEAEVATEMDAYARAHKVDHVFAPAFEVDGHSQHNVVGTLAKAVFGPEKVTHYLTYRRGYGKSRSEFEVPFEPTWPALKMVALSYYLSQIALPATQPWFLDSTLREWWLEPPPANLATAAEIESFADRQRSEREMRDLIEARL